MRPSAWPVMMAGSRDSGSRPLMMIRSACVPPLKQPVNRTKTKQAHCQNFGERACGEVIVRYFVAGAVLVFAAGRGAAFVAGAAFVVAGMLLSKFVEGVSGWNWVAGLAGAGAATGVVAGRC